MYAVGCPYSTRILLFIIFMTSYSTRLSMLLVRSLLLLFCNLTLFPSRSAGFQYNLRQIHSWKVLFVHRELPLSHSHSVNTWYGYLRLPSSSIPHRNSRCSCSSSRSSSIPKFRNNSTALGGTIRPSHTFLKHARYNSNTIGVIVFLAFSSHHLLQTALSGAFTR